MNPVGTYCKGSALFVWGEQCRIDFRSRRRRNWAGRVFLCRIRLLRRSGFFLTRLLLLLLLLLLLGLLRLLFQFVPNALGVSW